eukprot:jgi/Psemu1/37889/gm1.37889_g
MPVPHRGSRCAIAMARSPFLLTSRLILRERIATTPFMTQTIARSRGLVELAVVDRSARFAGVQRKLFHDHLQWHVRNARTRTRSYRDDSFLQFFTRHGNDAAAAAVHTRRSPCGVLFGFARSAFGSSGPHQSPRHFSHTTDDGERTIGGGPRIPGDRLRALLLQQQQYRRSERTRTDGRLLPATTDGGTPCEDALVAPWKHAEDVLRTSLREIRVLRARCERERERFAAGEEDVSAAAAALSSRQWVAMIGDCIRVLDRLSLSLPQAEDLASSWLFDRNPGVSSVPGPAETSVLDRSLLNELLKEWMMGWKATQQQQQQQQRQQPQQRLHGGSIPQGQAPNTKPGMLLPTPSAMAEKVDRYRSTCLIQPDPTSFNLLLHAMIRGEPSPHPRRRLAAVKLADDYLHRLVEAQSRWLSSSSHNTNNGHQYRYPYFDAVSVATVMKGWVDLGQPQRAHDWLDRTRTASVPPNAVAYATAIDGWAKARKPQKAESVLEMALSESLERLELEQLDSRAGADVDEKETTGIVIDRVTFHTVLDAWAAAAAASTIGNPGSPFVPAANRARALVETMHHLADAHPDRLADLLRPSDETYYKLIATVAAQQQPLTRTATVNANSDSGTGPAAAEALLNQFEDDTGSHSATPAIVLNRVLRAYCANGRQMEEAEFFFRRRCKILEVAASSHSHRSFQSSGTNTPRGSLFPDQVSFHTILTGWATAAEVASKRNKFRSNNNTAAAANAALAAAEIPFRAEAWLEEMQRYSHPPSTRAYGSVLQAWSLSTRCHEDAADRAEELLKRHVWKMLDDDHDHDRNRNHQSATATATGITICTNIVLRAWSNQIASLPAPRGSHHQTSATPSCSRAVGRCLRLLHDFLALARDAPKPLQLAPTAETFRAVLHAIVSPSNGMTPIQKYDHSRALRTCMMDGYKIRPGPADLKKFERIESMKQKHGSRQQRTKQDRNNNQQNQ